MTKTLSSRPVKQLDPLKLNIQLASPLETILGAVIRLGFPQAELNFIKSISLVDGEAVVIAYRHDVFGRVEVNLMTGLPFEDTFKYTLV